MTFRLRFVTRCESRAPRPANDEFVDDPPGSGTTPGASDADGDGIPNSEDCDSEWYEGSLGACGCLDDDGDGERNQNECGHECAYEGLDECDCGDVAVEVVEACGEGVPLVWVLAEGDSFPGVLVLSGDAWPAGGVYEWTITSGEGSVVEFPPGETGSGSSVVVGLVAGGAASVEVSYTIEGDAGVCESTASVELAVVERLRLKSVAFEGDHTVSRDTGEAYMEPEWLDENGDGDVEDAADHGWPIAYTRNTSMRVSHAVFDVVPSGLNLGTVSLLGTGLTTTFEASAVIEDAQGELDFDGLESSMALPDSVAYQPEALIGWELEFECGPTLSALSEHIVYVTLGEPMGSTLYETVVHLACKNAQGLDDEDAVVASIWDEFIDLDVRRVDGVQMKYWNPPDTVCQALEEMLTDSTGNGACGAWATLLRETFRAQGLSGVVVEIVPTYGGESVMLVRDWLFDLPGSAACPPFTHLESEIHDLPGAAGQGNPDPPGNFYNHYITRYDTRYYDPSYGTGPFDTLEDHEDASIDGFLRIDCSAPGAHAAKTNDPLIPEMTER